MQIIYHKRFKKALQKQDSYIQEKFSQALLTFMKNPRDRSIRNHVLRGNMKRYRSFDVTGDVRVHYQVSNGCFVLLDIGKHSELY